jgi:hypothetical protein
MTKRTFYYSLYIILLLLLIPCCDEDTGNYNQPQPKCPDRYMNVSIGGDHVYDLQLTKVIENYNEDHNPNVSDSWYIYGSMDKNDIGAAVAIHLENEAEIPSEYNLNTAFNYLQVSFTGDYIYRTLLGDNCTMQISQKELKSNGNPVFIGTFGCEKGIRRKQTEFGNPVSGEITVQNGEFQYFRMDKACQFDDPENAF